MWRRMMLTARPRERARLDELLALERERLAAHDARHVEPLDRADRDEDQHDVRPKNTTIRRITKKMNGSE